MDIPQKDHLPSNKTNPKRRTRKKGMCLEDRPVLEPNAAGIDVGAREMFVAVPPGRDKNPVRVFPTFTEDLERLVDWLLQCGVTTVAMESTGVYWIPLYDILAQRGIRPCLRCVEGQGVLVVKNLWLNDPHGNTDLSAVCSPCYTPRFARIKLPSLV